MSCGSRWCDRILPLPLLHAPLRQKPPPTTTSAEATRRRITTLFDECGAALARVQKHVTAVREQQQRDGDEHSSDSRRPLTGVLR